MARKIGLTVGSGGSGEPGLGLVAAEFERATGHTVRVTYDNRIIDGRPRAYDLIVASTDVIDREFRPLNCLEPGGIVVGRSQGLGIALRPGVFLGDLSDLPAFASALAAAEALLLTTHSSGLHVEARLAALGLHDHTANRLLRYPDGPTLMARLLAGHGQELAVLTVNQIRRYAAKGLIFAGPVPDELQHVLEFQAVPMTDSPHKDIAWAFAQYCAGPGRPVLAANGFG